MTDPRFPVPTTVSAQARAFLSAPPNPTAPSPAPDDLEGWANLARKVDAHIAARMAGIAFPGASREVDIDGAHTFELIPEGVDPSNDSPLYVDIHGGALLYGGGDLARTTGEITALSTGMEVWSIDYRMPPRHPYPAGLDDCMAVYRHALQEKDPRRIVVGGASAGGNLAAALLLRAKDEGLPLPAALVLLSPEADLTESGDSFTVLNGVDNVIGPLRDVNLLYAAGHDLADPYLSPLFGDFTGFPPTFVQTGTRDLLLSNGVLLHRALRRAGVPAQLHVFEAMPHGGFGGAPEDLELRFEVRHFLASALQH